MCKGSLIDISDFLSYNLGKRRRTIMTLGSNIQKIRKEASLSQEAFAEMFQVSRQTISNWENSKSYPDLETIIKISDSFHISLDVLLVVSSEL